MPKFEILEKSGLKNGAHNPQFLELSQRLAKEKNIDLYTVLYSIYFKTIKNAGFKLNDENFSYGHENVTYNAVVDDFLNELQQKGIDNYLLSSGIKVFLEKVSISRYFEEIYATTFSYNSDNEAIGIEFLMSDINKVNAIKEILKKRKIEDEDCKDVVYIGDGLTDYFVMKYVKEHGGTTIFVYQNEDSKDLQAIKDRNVVDFYTKADCSRDSELHNIVQKMCKTL